MSRAEQVMAKVAEEVSRARRGYCQAVNAAGAARDRVPMPAIREDGGISSPGPIRQVSRSGADRLDALRRSQGIG
jgi:hypothetical protein